MTENGAVLYDRENPVDIWMTDDLSDYIPSMTAEYERLFYEYGDRFDKFSWYVSDEDQNERSAVLSESHSGNGGETVTQIWTLDYGGQVRITACRSGSSFVKDANGFPPIQFQYQYHYDCYSGTEEAYSDVVSYDILPGRHRIDRLPEGFYVLVEEQVPEGYEKAAPKLIPITDNVDLQKYDLENRRKEVFVDKVDGDGKQVTGALLALYRPDAEGKLTEAKELFVDRWISGKEGIYTFNDRADGMIPEGYQPGDFRLHRLPAIEAGEYYLTEEQAPEYFIAMEPQKITIGTERQTVVKAKNRQAGGQLIIEKQDATWSGKTLSGAVFEVKNINTGECITMVTGEDGRAVSPILPVGSVGAEGVVDPYRYLVREIQPPDCYRLNFTEREVEFDGSSSGSEVLTYLLEIPNEETELLISKTDFGSGHFVKGARLAVYKARLEAGCFLPDGEAIEEWTSDGDSHRITGRLSAGRTYILMEINAPDGYGTAEPLVFSVSSDGRKLYKISDGLQQIQFTFEENEEKIKEAIITGRAGIHLEYHMEKNGSLRTLYERTIFSDGSSVLTNKETFRIDEGEEEPAGVYPRQITKTELILTHRRQETETVAEDTETGDTEADGSEPDTESKSAIIDIWDVAEGEEMHRIENGKDPQSGGLIFNPGKEYVLEERCHYSDGEVLTTSRVAFGIGEEGAIGHLILENRQTEVHFRKIDSTDREILPGASLELWTEEGFLVDQWITGQTEHVVCGKLIPGRTYILREKKPAGGYGFAEEIRFTVNEEGCTETVRMDDKPTHVCITKADITTGKELVGAHMTLKDEDGTILDRWISSAKPHEITAKLIAGKQYTLHEENPPGGYAWAQDVIFTVSLDGKIDRVVMEDKPTTVVIRKSDITTGQELPGAHMEIRDKTGQTVEKWISKDTPHEIKARLTAGETYTLHETGAPGGYAFAKEITFTVSRDGTIDKIVMEDKPTVVTVEKRSEDGQNLLGGAVLQILNRDGRILEEWVTEEGKVHRLTGVLHAGESYILREIQPPPGYKKAADIKFTVSLDGSEDKIVMVDQEAQPGREPEPEREEPPEIVIRKLDRDTGEALPGAEFTIYDENGRIYQTVTTGRGGKAVFARPEPGIYTYRETKAPDSYIQCETEYSFTVTDSGKVIGTFMVYNEREPVERRRLGSITASYSAGFDGKGAVYLDEDGKIRLRIPEAGDEGNLGVELFMSILSAVLFVWLLKKRREM